MNLDSGPVSAGQVMTAALLALYESNVQARPVYADLATVTLELAHPSHAEHDYDGYVKLALAILASAVERGAAPAKLLGPFLDTANLNREDAQLAELLSRMRKLLPAAQPDIPPP